MLRLVQIRSARKDAGFHLETTVYGSGWAPVQEAGPVVCPRAGVLDPRSMRPFVLPIQGKEGAGSSQADPLPLLRLQPGRRYGSDGTE
jgi:hypothetical protein